MKLTKCKGLNSSVFFFREILYIVNEEISFKENTKHIKLLKKTIIERKFQNMLKEIFTNVPPKYSTLHKERKK